MGRNDGGKQRSGSGSDVGCGYGFPVAARDRAGARQGRRAGNVGLYACRRKRCPRPVRLLEAAPSGCHRSPSGADASVRRVRLAHVRSCADRAERRRADLYAGIRTVLCVHPRERQKGCRQSAGARRKGTLHAESRRRGGKTRLAGSQDGHDVFAA